jgi:hypothetical protein
VWQTRVVRLSTTNPRIPVPPGQCSHPSGGGSVSSETIHDDRACRDVRHPRFDGFVESNVFVLQPDGTVKLPTPRQVHVDMTDEPLAGTTEELMTLPKGHTIRVRGGVARLPALPPPGALPSITQPSARCTGPGPRVSLLLGVVELDRPKCGRRPCERRDLGPSGSSRGGDVAVKGFHGCGQ